MSNQRAAADVHPRLAAALTTQLDRRRAALDQGARHVGWKIGGNIPEVDEVTAGRPAIGYLTSASLLDDGGTYRAGAATLHADTEVVIELGRDVGPDCGTAAAAAAIAGLGVGLELVDLGRPPSDLEGIVAANVFHRAFALGPSVPVTLTPDAEARSIVNGEVRVAGRVGGGYGETVQTVARLLDVVGERLRRGDRIFAGSVTQVEVAPGDEVTAEIDGLGRLAVAIA
jgi:2-keto-4-pentenoate hydratase